MRALLKAELIKLRTTRTFVALAASAVGISLLITVLVASITEPTEEDVLTDVFTSDVSGLFIMILAIIGISGEWRHHTITSSLLAAPDRVRFLAAKTIAFAIAGLVLSVLISIAVGVAAWRSSRRATCRRRTSASSSSSSPATRASPRWEVRSASDRRAGAQPGRRDLGVLIAAFAVEPALVALVPEVGRFGPFGALPTAAQGLDPEDVGMPEDVDLPAAGVAVLLLLAWIGSAFAGGVALLRYRDLE